MSAIDPTCLPWQTKHDFDTEGATTIIGNVDGEIIDGTTHHTFDFVARTLDLDDDSQSHSVAVANAAFIVRACNSHYELLEALQAAEKLYQDGILFTPNDEIERVHQLRRAAIARATGAA